MVERRRSPLVLSSTRATLRSVLQPDQIPGRPDSIPRTVKLTAGILKWRRDGVNDSDSSKFDSFDDSSLVGLSTQMLKRLSINSGSFVVINNVDIGIQRLAQVVVLDPPPPKTTSLEDASSLTSLDSLHTMLVFPTFDTMSQQLLNQEVAYLSPMLAFNLSLHMSCLKSLVHRGDKVLEKYFVAKFDEELDGNESKISLDLEPVSEVPAYASHLRVSFVKIPECGTIQSLVVNSSFEDEERQGLIDSALHKYFGTDRQLSRGDVFRVYIEWNCGSSICIPCSQGLGSRSEGDFIYFKVVAMEPSNERFLRVNHFQTALVLGGTVSSGLPPDLLVSSSEVIMPLQVDTVNVLASVLSPPLCPSALSSKLRVAVLLHGLPGCGKRTVVNYVARRLGLHVVEYSCHSLLASSERKTSTALAQTFNMARRYAPTILLLRHFEVFKNLGSQDGSQGDRVGVASEIASIIRELTEPVSNGEYSSMEENSNSNSSVDEGGKFRGHQVLLIASSESTEGLSPTIRRCFSHEIRMGSLNDEQRSEMLSQSLQGVSKLLNTSSDEFVKDLVGQTSGFLPRDLRALVADTGANLFMSKESETEKVNSLSGDLLGVNVDHSRQLGNSSETPTAKDDFTKALDRSKKRNASALGAPKVPNVKWDDVGGLEDVKSSILDTVQLPLLHKDLFSSGLRKRSGVLLYGPPGTGKTLLAKAVATECSLNFLSVKGPELINMYIGESEKNVRDIFEKARSARPCVIFFDELDSLAPARGASGDSGGVMDRVVSQMLAEIDGLSDSSQDLFIIGASNRPDLIDPALLRPGRFDKLLYVGVNADASYRERVLKALTRKFKLSEDVSLYSVAKKCPSTFTGADMYALCADAWFQAAKRKVLNSDSGDDSLPEDDPDSVVVEFVDFIKAMDQLSPSLSITELKKYEALRDQFQGRSN
ncbi:unnamed protein product [Eruca vesicaria subsp. sativa]|uniref:Peroxisomal ATPase PEX6 n=1 Tax=Eruca vesicaria subsp. sativa TaxID=29727 RepID=A0ABC8JPX8_ERUVS|nr:unnamed protein product [Eruca vesicaria subsp. sativa]